jgi:hypothetical protein
LDGGLERRARLASSMSVWSVPAAATDTYYSFTTSAGASFHYFPAKSTAAAAAAACNQLTAHLAWYTSLAEQREVEQVGAPELRACQIDPECSACPACMQSTAAVATS